MKKRSAKKNPSPRQIAPRATPEKVAVGRVKGPGGPTDDAIPALLPPGGYVLPADTTQAMDRYCGGGAIKRAEGGGVPARVSNGESVLDKDMVYQVGKAALGAALQMTHAVQDEDHDGYANGGVVEWARNLLRNPNEIATEREMQQMQDGTYAGQQPAVMPPAPASTSGAVSDIPNGFKAITGRMRQIDDAVGRAEKGYADGGDVEKMGKQYENDPWLGLGGVRRLIPGLAEDTNGMRMTPPPPAPAIAPPSAPAVSGGDTAAPPPRAVPRYGSASPAPAIQKAVEAYRSQSTPASIEPPPVGAVSVPRPADRESNFIAGTARDHGRQVGYDYGVNQMGGDGYYALGSGTDEQGRPIGGDVHKYDRDGKPLPMRGGLSILSGPSQQAAGGSAIPAPQAQGAAGGGFDHSQIVNHLMDRVRELEERSGGIDPYWWVGGPHHSQGRDIPRLAQMAHIKELESLHNSINALSGQASALQGERYQLEGARGRTQAEMARAQAEMAMKMPEYQSKQNQAYWEDMLYSDDPKQRQLATENLRALHGRAGPAAGKRYEPLQMSEDPNTGERTWGRFDNTTGAIDIPNAPAPRKMKVDELPMSVKMPDGTEKRLDSPR